ncbi:putative F-box associated interaction domain-containing protein [Helianthus debilis subsp. tardiflorus]
MDSDDLSFEMLMEITSRASLETLDIMRCMSKELNKLSYESYLLDLYKKRNNIVSGFLIQDMKSEWMDIKEFAPSRDSNCLDLGFLPSNARILATSEQGIMVYQTPDSADFRNGVYHVCKPATRQVLALPSPKAKYKVCKVALVVMGLRPLHYKIIRFSDHPALKRGRKFYTRYSCDIFDSTMWEWRSRNHIKLDDGVFFTNPQPVTKSGSIYMLLTNNDIFKFDAYSEKWEVFPPPIRYDPYGTASMDLVKYGGKLGVAYKPPNANGCREIWVCTTDGLWEKEGVAGEGERETESLKALYDSDTSVVAQNDTLLFYKFKQEGDNMINKVALSDILIPCEMFNFRSDFEPIDLI